MSKMTQRHVYTSESVSEGHPDKVCDQLSDAVVDACLEQDSESRIACESLVTSDLIVLSGEITTKADVRWEQLARRVVNDIGYNSPDVGFCADSCKVLLCIHPQSQDIAQGVTEGAGRYTDQGAGDQGMMFGYASDETAELMPAPVLYAHRIVERLAHLRHQDPETYAFLRPDAKSQVSFVYDQGQPVNVSTIVVSHQHTPDATERQLRELVEAVVQETIPSRFLT